MHKIPVAAGNLFLYKMKIDSLVNSINIEGRIIPLNDWNLLQISGKDCEKYLHGQTTSHVKSLKQGESQLSALINLKGGVDSFFYLFKRKEDFLLLVLKELKQRTIERLEKYIIMEDVLVHDLDTGELLLYIGPKYRQLLESCKAAFPISIFSHSAVFIHSKDDVSLLREKEQQNITEHEFYALKFFSDFPCWRQEISGNNLVNNTVLGNNAISYTKGCFVGQEVVAKVHNNNGATFFTVILKLEKRTSSLEEYIGQDFFINDKKAGTITNSLLQEDSSFLRAKLHRNFITPSEKVLIRFSNSVEFAVTVHQLPFFKNVTEQELSLKIYHYALKAFADETADDESIISLLEDAIAITPAFPDAYESLGVIWGRRKEYDKAIRYMDLLLDVDPDSVMAHANKSLYLMQAGRIEEAEKEKGKAFLATIKAQEKKTKQQEELNKEVAERNKKREQMFLQVLEIDSKDTLANFSLSQLYNESGNYEDAFKFSTITLENDKSYSAAYLEKGIAVSGLKKYEAAKAIYQEGITVATSKGEQVIVNKIKAKLTEIP